MREQAVEILFNRLLKSHCPNGCKAIRGQPILAGVGVGPS